MKNPKPCPFCGGPADYKPLWHCVLQGKLTPLGVPHGCVKCSVCGARSATWERKRAVREWNKRAKTT